MPSTTPKSLKLDSTLHTDSHATSFFCSPPISLHAQYLARRSHCVFTHSKRLNPLNSPTLFHLVRRLGFRPRFWGASRHLIIWSDGVIGGGALSSFFPFFHILFPMHIFYVFLYDTRMG
ncbi:hypothetical protein FRC08_000764 [Ceratobasidium sp. 394]|nr:hypothetical protein FRC08_000764 [Ceratobasidium sp. 394]